MSRNASNDGRDWRDWLRHAFAVPGSKPLSDADRELLIRMAEYLLKRRLGEAAVMALETCRPLNFVGSQALVFLKPFVHLVFKKKNDFDRFTDLLEDRETIGRLIDILEARLSGSEKPEETA